MMATFAWHCDRCPATYPTATLLARHVGRDHHPLNTAIDYLLWRIGRQALGGASDAQLQSSRRLVIRLYGERAYDCGLTPHIGEAL